MADGKIKISELTSALQINDDAKFPYSQDNSGTETTFGAEITQIARKIAEGVTLTNLQTTTKNLVGAINELKSDGAIILYGTSAPTSQQGSNGNLYVKYTSGTPDTVTNLYVKLDGSWCEIETGGGGGSGGHTIVDDEGTSLTQRTNLQFNGTYLEDNSTDDTTEVNVVREMTYAEFQQLSADEKKGIIEITDITGGDDNRFQPVIYSEDEREIGVWTDGKPLYVKTYTSTTTVGFNSDTEMVLNTGIPADTEIKSVWGMLDLTLSDAHYIANSTNWFKYYYNVLTEKIFASQSLASATPTSTLAVFTIRYTKSSDSAGSGTWTPQGVPTHHYSTSEKIVGTWIDGSTIYERTFDKSSVSLTNGSWTNNVLGTNGSGIKIRKFSGTFNITISGTSYSNSPYADYIYFRSTTEYFTAVINDSGDDLNLRPNINGVSMTAGVCTIQYTKTGT